MTEVLHSPSHFTSSPRKPSPSSSPSTSLSCSNSPNNGPIIISMQNESISSSSSSVNAVSGIQGDFTVRGCETEDQVKDRDRNRRDQLSLLALLVTLFRKSLIACKIDRRELCAMEIGLPTNVRHVAHVTFDRFNGFLGLPVEFEPEVPRRVPSASTTVFGVSTESMQLSYDSRGNSVPTILLLMQQRLYSQGGLQAEGIFRINAENSQEEFVREQLNSGVVPEGIDVHCLAGLIKAWFRELPTGVLDSLSPEQVMQCHTEEEYVQLVTLLPPTEAALLDWAINLMADVVQHEHLNKMNERNIAMVFAPNMTQMADPLTALMYAVQVMNFLKTLILRTLRERGDIVLNPPACHLEPSDKNGHESPSRPLVEVVAQNNEEEDPEFTTDDPVCEAYSNSFKSTNGDESCIMEAGSVDDDLVVGVEADAGKSNNGQSSNLDFKKGLNKLNAQQPCMVQTMVPIEKVKEISNLSRVNSRTEKIEAWR